MGCTACTCNGAVEADDVLAGTMGALGVGAFIRASLITVGTLVPATVGYTLHAASEDRRDPRFRRIKAAAIAVGELGTGAAASTVAGVLALLGRAKGGGWMSAARVSAGLGVGLLGAGVAGLGTLLVEDRLRYPPQP